MLVFIAILLVVREILLEVEGSWFSVQRRCNLQHVAQQSQMDWFEAGKNVEQESAANEQTVCMSVPESSSRLVWNFCASRKTDHQKQTNFGAEIWSFWRV